MYIPCMMSLSMKSNRDRDRDRDRDLIFEILLTLRGYMGSTVGHDFFNALLLLFDGMGISLGFVSSFEL